MQNFNSIIVDETDSNIRIDSFLTNILDNYSRTKVQNIIKNKEVFINNASCKPSQIIKTDDIITFNLESLREINIESENIPLNIIYETAEFAIINKPSGILTHPTSIHKSGTLVNALLYHFHENLSDLNGKFRSGIIHRLDKNTSGLLIIAKNNIAHEKLAEMIKNREIEKHYRAIVKGIITEDLVINAPIGRSKTNPTKMAVVPNGKPSLSEITVIKQFDNATYIDINLKTGRTHQIRVHLSHIGHPVFNDTLYGFGKQKIKTEEQVLQAYKLKFINPFNNQLINIEIEEDAKIKKVLNYLETNFEKRKGD